MKVSKFLNNDISLLGFGCMRFPVDENNKINEEEASKMLDYAISHGVNYLDTAYPYHDGESERFLGRYLKKYDRNSYYLASKFPIWLCNKKEDIRKLFFEQLDKLQVKYLDFYLVHAMNKDRFNKLKELDIYNELNKLREEGYIRYIGFSFHDEYDVFEQIITSYPWDFCQIQYNYLDRDIQAGDKGVALAEKLNIPIIIMEPLKGGNLSSFAPNINELFYKLDKNKSISSYAFRFLYSKKIIKVILSGMSTLEQVIDNVNTFSNITELNEQENDLLNRVRDIELKKLKVPCTNCKYCMPCPFGVNIPLNFKIYNDYFKFNNLGVSKQEYSHLNESEKSLNCKHCNACLNKCPQHLNIPEYLKEITSFYNK